MSQQHESESKNGSHVGGSSSKKATNPHPEFGPLLAKSALESEAQEREIRSGFFNTYRILICIWMGLSAFV